VESILDTIKGIGPQTQTLLLKEFKSVKGIIAANDEDIIKLIGKSKGEIIIDSLKKEPIKNTNQE